MVPRHRRMKVAGETIREKRAARGNLCMLHEGPWLGGEVGDLTETSGRFHRPPCIQWRGQSLESSQAEAPSAAPTQTHRVLRMAQAVTAGSFQREFSLICSYQ